jgi:hypothetical protein
MEERVLMQAATEGEIRLNKDEVPIRLYVYTYVYIVSKVNRDFARAESI